MSPLNESAFRVDLHRNEGRQRTTTGSHDGRSRVHYHKVSIHSLSEGERRLHRRSTSQPRTAISPMTTIPTSPLQIPLSFAGEHGDPAAAWDDRELVDAWDAAAEEWKVSFHLVQTTTSSTHAHDPILTYRTLFTPSYITQVPVHGWTKRPPRWR
jgi:hypothetical protein